ncbi:MAG: UDP-N-acetylmuramate dehydrogenase [Clostridia bacterium]|nr:UDP-N-acetylmuramate dehydrogenase [Clostridia bacterium]
MSVTERFRDFAASIHCAFKEGEPLSAYTSFRIGGPAELILFPQSAQMLRQIMSFCAETQTVPFVLGKGSNLLIDDRGLSGVTICTERMQNCELLSENEILCEAGLPLSKLCLFAQSHGLAGLEFAYGIPGSVGGAVYMNAGAYGGEIRDVLSCVTSADRLGRQHVHTRDDLELGYRTSVFQTNGEIVLSGIFQLDKGDPDQIRVRMDEILQRRKDKQPLNYPSAGSVFKRPQGYFAGALIEQCGLKGFSVGGAQVSEKHAGFIVNRGGASSSDVLRLIEIIRETVEKETGVVLEPEIRRIP